MFRFDLDAYGPIGVRLVATLLLIGCAGNHAPRRTDAGGAPSRHAPGRSADPPSGTWKLDVPSQWNGPVDDTLSSYNCLVDTSVCPRDDGAVLVTWSRSFAHWAGSEPERRRIYPVKWPAHRAAAPDWAGDQAGHVAACIIDKADNARRFMLAEVGCNPKRRWLLGPIVHRANRWEAALCLEATDAPNPDDTTSTRLYLAPISDLGWETPVPVSGAKEIEGPFIAMTARDDELDVYRRAWFLPYGRFTFPDSGLETIRLLCVRIKGNKVIQERPVYTKPFQTYDFDGHRVLPVSGSRVDLVFSRDEGHQPGRAAGADLIHVADILGWWPRTQRAAHIERQSWGEHLEYVPVVHRDESVQILWLLHAYDDAGPHPEARLFEVHQQNSRWISPREVFAVDTQSNASLAAVAARQGDQEVVVVVWCGADGNLTYCLSADAETWSVPQKTELVLGWPNWLVPAGDTLVLVSGFYDNLFWCRMRLVCGGPGADPDPVSAHAEEGD